jgi:hypothetical protein
MFLFSGSVFRFMSPDMKVEIEAGPVRTIAEYRARNMGLDGVCAATRDPACRQRWPIDLVRARQVFGAAGTTDLILPRARCPACGSPARRLDPVLRAPGRKMVWGFGHND